MSLMEKLYADHGNNEGNVLVLNVTFSILLNTLSRFSLELAKK